MDNDFVKVEISQFMVAAIMQKFALYDEDGDLITDADEYDPIVVEGRLVTDERN